MLHRRRKLITARFGGYLMVHSYRLCNRCARKLETDGFSATPVIAAEMQQVETDTRKTMQADASGMAN